MCVFVIYGSFYILFCVYKYTYIHLLITRNICTELFTVSIYYIIDNILWNMDNKIYRYMLVYTHAHARVFIYVCMFYTYIWTIYCTRWLKRVHKNLVYLEFLPDTQSYNSVWNIKWKFLNLLRILFKEVYNIDSGKFYYNFFVK